MSMRPLRPRSTAKGSTFPQAVAASRPPSASLSPSPDRGGADEESRSIPRRMGPRGTAGGTSRPRRGTALSQWEKQLVFFRTNEAPGTIVVNTAERYLYLVQGNNRAMRYGIGVGRDGFQWKGLVTVVRKQEWPDWRPPPEMIQRQPYLPRFMAGGPGNPMGARALYLGGTVYRIHGTNQPQTIGSAVSSGCFRLVNADVIDLFERVPVGTKVVVRQAAEL